MSGKKKYVEVKGSQTSVGVALLGGLGLCLFGPVGAAVMGAIGYCSGQRANSRIAEQQLPDSDFDGIGSELIDSGDKRVVLTLKKTGTGYLTPLGRAIFGDYVQKRVIYDNEVED